MSSPKQLKTKEIKGIREEKLILQDHTCPLCGNKVEKDEAVLDHDHSTGRVRQVLHRSCNQTEGRILSWINRCRGDDPEVFIGNLLMYWQTNYEEEPLHPQHLVEQARKFKNKGKPDQISILEEMNIELHGKETKQELLKLYKKAIR